MISQSAQTQLKLFVLDTNVILHDARSFQNFKEHDVALPITVLEELDRFKKGNEDINFQAREFLRQIDQMTGDVLSEEGAELGEDQGRLRVVITNEIDHRLHQVFLHDSPDNRILNTALHLQHYVKERRVILITKDTNLRMKAKSLGLQAQDYINDKIESSIACTPGDERWRTSPPSRSTVSTKTLATSS